MPGNRPALADNDIPAAPATALATTASPGWPAVRTAFPAEGDAAEPGTQPGTGKLSGTRFYAGP